MLESDALTVEDVCELLSLSRNTVYKLAKEGTLPSFKVGRKLRFFRADVERVLAERSAEQATQPAAEAPTPSNATSSITLQQAVDGVRGATGTPFVLAGEDAVLGLLAHRIRPYGYNPSVINANSYTALISLYTGQADAAVTCLYDFKTNSYNTPFAQRLCPGVSLTVVHLFRRRQGLFVRAGNPKNIKTWGALTHEDVRIAARERGNSHRILMDQKMLGLEACMEEVESRTTVCDSNALALARVSKGLSDVCLGYKDEGSPIKGVQFIPQQIESVDIVIRHTKQTQKTIKTIRQIASSDAFAKELARMGSCDTERCGSVIYQC